MFRFTAHLQQVRADLKVDNISKVFLCVCRVDLCDTKLRISFGAERCLCNSETHTACKSSIESCINYTFQTGCLEECFQRFQLSMRDLSWKIFLWFGFGNLAQIQTASIKQFLKQISNRLLLLKQINPQTSCRAFQQQIKHHSSFAIDVLRRGRHSDEHIQQ